MADTSKRGSTLGAVATLLFVGMGVNSTSISENLPQQPPNKVRIEAIDVLRGFALLGILLMNMPFFATPSDSPSGVVSDQSGINLSLWYYVDLFFEGKMRAIFSMLFGASAVIFLSANTLRSADLYYRRTIWLILFGIAHSMLIWIGDILYFYGMAGLLLFPFRNLQGRWLIAIAVGLAAVSSLQLVAEWHDERTMFREYEIAMALQSVGTPLDPEQLEAITEWTDHVAETPNPEKSESIIRKYRKGYFEFLPIRSSYAKHIHSIAIYSTEFLDALIMMLIGIALYRWGVFSGTLGTGTYLAIALISYCIAIPINWLVTDDVYSNAWQWHNVSWYSACSYDLTRFSMALGHIGLLMFVYRLIPRVVAPLAPVGRMALTNYLLTSLVCTMLFQGYGLGWFGYLERWQWMLLMPPIWIGNLLFSHFWLQRYEYGPVEWFWRVLTRWELASLPRNPKVFQG